MNIKKIFFCVILTVVLFLSGCSQAKPYYNDINVGMSYEQVVEILGREPDSYKENPGDTNELICLWQFSNKQESLIVYFRIRNSTDPCVCSVKIAKNDKGVIL